MDHQGVVKAGLSLLQSWWDRFEVCSLLLCQNTLDRVHVWECGSCNWQGHPLPVPPGIIFVYAQGKIICFLLLVRRNKLVKKFYKYLKLSSGFLAWAASVLTTLGTLPPLIKSPPPFGDTCTSLQCIVSKLKILHSTQSPQECTRSSLKF